MSEIAFTDVTQTVINEINSIPDFDSIKRGICTNSKSKRENYINEYISNLKRNVKIDEIKNGNQVLLNDWNTEESKSDFFIQTNDLGFSPNELNRFSQTVKEQIDIIQFDSVKPDYIEFVLQRQDSDKKHPQLFSISIPKEFIRDEKTKLSKLAFSIYFHTPLSNGIGGGFYVGDNCLKANSDANFYPFGWDFLFHVLLKNKILLVKAHTLSKKKEIVIVPILNHEPVKSAAGVVIDEVALGEMNNNNTMIDIIDSIQKYLIKKYSGNDVFKLPYELNFYAFSGGNVSLLKLLATIKIPSDYLKKVSFFDPPEYDRTGLISFIERATSKRNFYDLGIQLYIKRTSSIPNWLSSKIEPDKIISYGESESLKIGLIQDFKKDNNLSDNSKHWKVRDLFILDAISRL